MNALIEQLRREYADRGQTAFRNIAVDTDYLPLFRPRARPEIVVDGCYSCYRTSASIKALGHTPDCPRFHTR